MDEDEVIWPGGSGSGSKSDPSLMIATREWWIRYMAKKKVTEQKTLTELGLSDKPNIDFIEQDLKSAEWLELREALHSLLQAVERTNLPTIAMQNLERPMEKARKALRSQQ